jgi:hypothetical protein
MLYFDIVRAKIQEHDFLDSVPQLIDALSNYLEISKAKMSSQLA